MSRKPLPNRYYAVHKRTVRARGRATEYLCMKCGKQAEDWAQVHGTDGEDPGDYQPMCTSCHMRYDQGIEDGECGNGHVVTEQNTWMRGTKRVCTDCMKEARQRWLDSHRDEFNARQQERRGTANPCPPGCTCWRHRSSKCQPGCTCGRHRKAASL